MDLKSKYLKYKTKYLQLKKISFTQTGGVKNNKNLKNKSIERIMNNNNNNNINDNNKQGGMEPNHIENLSEPWFTLISLGLKTVEGRKNKGRFKEMKPGDIIKWTNNDFAPRSVMTRVTSKAEYQTFQEYLETEGLYKCLPGIKDIETGLSVYFKYFTKTDESEFGVVAIKLELV